MDGSYIILSQYFSVLLGIAKGDSSNKTQDTEWDYIVYTQEWPQSACIDANDTVGIMI